MPWAKVDDQWFAHRKVVTLSLAARGLWTTALSWSCAQRTDHVPEHMARFLAGEDVSGPAGELVAAGLWHENGDGWVIHDWAEYQEKSVSEKRAEAGRRGGEASGESRREANGKQTDGASEANDEAGTQPFPARPVPEDTPPSDDGFEDFWDAYPRHHDTQAKGGGGNKQTAKKRWRKLSKVEKAEVAEAVGPYAKLCAPGGQKPKHAERFLINDAWQAYLPAARDGPKSDKCRLCDRPLSAEDHDELCEVFQ